MVEKIYTIPVNEAFDACSGCPHCALYKKLEDSELDIILGAAMMEPDTRIQTNAEGFCGKHFGMMFNLKNRLGLALMIESHLSENINKALKSGRLFRRGPRPPHEHGPRPPHEHEQDDSGAERGGWFRRRRSPRHHESCYVCARIDYKLSKMLETTALLWEREREFKDKLAGQPYFCIPHYTALLSTGEYTLHKRVFPDYSDACRRVMVAYSEKLLEDVSWFIKKFDYRYQEEPWGDSKDAVERAIRFLSEYKKLDNL